MQFSANESAQALSYLTLGSYGDLTSLLAPTTPEATASAFAWGLTALKWILLCLAIFLFWRWVCERLKLIDLIPVLLTVATVIVALWFYNTPWNDAETIAMRVSSFSNALSSTSVNYTPSVLQPMINLTKMPVDFIDDTLKTVENSIPKNITAPVIQGDGSLPTIGSSEFDTSWLRFLVYALLSFASIYLLSRISKVLAGVIAAIIFLLAINISNDTIACIILIIACLAAIWLLRKTKILIAYPLTVIILCLAYILQPPQNILLLFLIAAFVVSLLPIFYGVGAGLYTAGEILEAREKLGMKLKPKKAIEEYAGRWDVNAVAIILTLLFVAIIGLFSVSLSGLGTFLAISVALLRR